MEYALLAYGRPAGPDDAPDGAPSPIGPALERVLQQPGVTGWLRLRSDETATTVRGGAGRALLTDGPFVDSKEYLAGLILVEAPDLDGALEIAQALQDARAGGGAIEVRPVLDGFFRGA
jgi:hypothetical protein